jgi:hypothetical protein
MAKPLFYKVVELSTVDEGSLENTVNHWVTQGWNLDGVQFAMRESSKRPSMAFVFFTRSDIEEAPRDSHEAQERLDREEARERLRRLAEGGEESGPPREADPWKRLAQLADEDEPS